MLTDYFRYLRFSRSSFPGFYILDYNQCQYFACAYGDRYLGKRSIVEIMKSLKGFAKVRSGEFDFHHIVERPHLADISVTGSTVNDNYPGMPAVMIHNGEHGIYNMTLHAPETRLIYLERPGESIARLPDTTDSENNIRKLFSESKEEAKKVVKRRIVLLKEIYAGVYEGNDLLKIVANNILDSYSAKLTLA